MQVDSGLSKNSFVAHCTVLKHVACSISMAWHTITVWSAVTEEHACIEVKAGRLYCSALVGDPDNFLDETRTWLNDSELRPGIPELNEHLHSCQQQLAGPFSATCPACRLLIPADTRSKASLWYVHAVLCLFHTGHANTLCS